jgi:hypothetical protein
MRITLHKAACPIARVVGGHANQIQISLDQLHAHFRAFLPLCARPTNRGRRTVGALALVGCGPARGELGFGTCSEMQSQGRDIHMNSRREPVEMNPLSGRATFGKQGALRRQRRRDQLRRSHLSASCRNGAFRCGGNTPSDLIANRTPSVAKRHNKPAATNRRETSSANVRALLIGPCSHSFERHLVHMHLTRDLGSHINQPRAGALRGRPVELDAQIYARDGGPRFCFVRLNEVR